MNLKQALNVRVERLADLAKDIFGIWTRDLDPEPVPRTRPDTIPSNITLDVEPGLLPPLGPLGNGRNALGRRKTRAGWKPETRKHKQSQPGPGIWYDQRGHGKSLRRTLVKSRREYRNNLSLMA